MNRIFHIVLWIFQALIALLFIWGAFVKLIEPPVETAKMIPWAGQNRMLVILTGLVDLAGGLGLILPMALRIKPILTYYAALGGIALMVSAIFFHVSRGETPAIGMNIGIIVLLGLVALGRKSVGRDPLKVPVKG